MALLYDETTSTSITEYVSASPNQDVTKVENTALDGTYYLQIIGSPEVTYKLVAYVTEAGQDNLFGAEADGDLMRVDVDRGTYYGRITSLKFSDRLAQGYRKATITLAKEAE